VKLSALALLVVALVLPGFAAGEPKTSRRLSPISAERVWQVGHVTLALDLPVFWDSHFMAAISDSRQIVAVDLKTGQQIWTRPLPEGSLASQIAQVGDHLVVLSDRLVEGVFLSTGATSWTAQLPCRPQSAARFVRGLAVLTCAAGSIPGESRQDSAPIVGFDIHSGRLLWKLVPGRGVFWDQIQQDAYYYLDAIRGTAAGPTPGAVVAVDVATGAVLWRRELRDAVGRLAVFGETVVASSASDITGISTQTGQVKYQRSINREGDGPAEDARTELVVCEGNVFVLGRSGVQSVAGDTGNLRAVLRYPPSPPRMSPGGRGWFLICEGSRTLLVAWLADRQQRVFLWQHDSWRPVRGLAHGDTPVALIGEQMVVTNEEGLAGYRLSLGNGALKSDP
jgi:outer membrane protein assembly factor BamB